VSTVAGQIIVLGNSLAGYIEAKTGRQLTFMVAVGNVPIATTAEFEQVTEDQAKMTAAIQQPFDAPAPSRRSDRSRCRTVSAR
jgi:hypothetical protein